MISFCSSRISSAKNIRQTGWFIGRFDKAVEMHVSARLFAKALPELQAMYQEYSSKTPYGVPRMTEVTVLPVHGNPSIWATITVTCMLPILTCLHRTIFSNAVNTCSVHPGRNQAAFVTGVGAETMKAAYGVNRADWSYIPGGVSPLGYKSDSSRLARILHFPVLMAGEVSTI